jgi:uncharacterized protein
VYTEEQRARGDVAARYQPGETTRMGIPSRFRILYDPPAPSEFVAEDCDCACAATPPLSAANTLPEGQPLHAYAQQQQFALDGPYHAVVVPSVSRVTVLNDDALALLQRFAQPLPLAALDTEERAAAQELVQAGLLTTSDVTLPTPERSRELVAWLHVTNACNLRCTYCYIDKTDEAMSAETAYAAIDAILHAARRHGYQAVRLKYAGGEASLNLPLVEQAHTYARQQAAAAGIDVSGVVLSNGVALTRHKLRCIARLGLRLMISLDGPADFHDAQRPRLGGQGSFQAAAASIERAHAMGLPLTVSITITGASVHGLPPLLEWLLEREIHFTLNFYRACDASTSHADLQLDEQQLIAGMRAAYEAIEHHLPRYSLLGCLLDRTNLGLAHTQTCSVGENYLVIDHHGNVARCHMDLAHPSTTIQHEDVLGALRHDPAGIQNVPVDEKEGCCDCAWKYWCAGGCPLATFRATGRYDVQSPNCGIYRALYPSVIRLEALRLLRRYDQAS